MAILSSLKFEYSVLQTVRIFVSIPKKKVIYQSEVIIDKIVNLFTEWIKIFIFPIARKFATHFSS